MNISGRLVVDGLIVTAMHNISSGTNHDGDLETTIFVLMEHGVSFSFYRTDWNQYVGSWH
jgi:hypothetical protein